MEIIGVLLVFIMPLLTGYMLCEITRQKETNQIETYLIGFFFLFFIQGVVFSACVFTGQAFGTACMLLKGIDLGIIILSCIFFVLKMIPRIKLKTGVKHTRLRKDEGIYFGVMIFVLALVLLRVFLNANFIRQDVMLETVKTTLHSGTMFKIHPLTGQTLEAGYITSKKIITLPLFYAFMCETTKLSPNVLLYMVSIIQTIAVAILSASLFVIQMDPKNRKRIFMFVTILGVILLSGDYFDGIITQRLLCNGYAGDVICAGCILPYLLYEIKKWYDCENGENPPSAFIRISYIGKIALGLMASVFITGLATGPVFLFVIIIIAGLCALIKTIREVRA